MQNDNKTDNMATSIAKGSIVVFLGQTSKFVFSYILVLMLTKYIGAERFGLYHLGITIILAASVISKIGLDNGAVRLISVYRGQNDTGRIRGVFFSCIIFVLIFSIGIGSVLFIFNGAISQKYFGTNILQDVLNILIYILPFISCSFIFFSTIQAFKANKYFTYITGFIDPLSKIIFFLIFLLFGMNLYGILYSHLISSIIVFFSGLWVINKISPIFRGDVELKYEIRKLLNFSIPLSFASFFQLALDWTDTLMLGYFSAAKYVGVYAAALKLSLIGSVILQSFNYIFAPIISETYEKKDAAKLKYLFKLAARWIFVSTLPVSLIFIIYPHVLMGFFGKEFQAGSLCLIILTIGQFINYMTGSVGYMLIMTGRSKITMINTISAAILNIALNFYMIPKFGIVGAAIATSVSLCFINLIRLLEVAVLLKMHPYDWQFIKPILSGIIVGNIYYLIIPKTVSSLSGFMLLCASFLALYFLIVYLMGIGMEEKEILRKTKNKIFEVFGK